MPGLGLGMAGGAHGLVAGKAGFWGDLAAWVWGPHAMEGLNGIIKYGKNFSLL